MKKYNYIKRVNAHISGKQRKNEVETELFDHMDEKEHFLREIGYDETASDEKADEAMGDADLVGEQLDLVGKRLYKSKRFSYIFSAVSVLFITAAYILLSLTDISGSFSSVMIKYFYAISPLFSFCMFSVVFILGLLDLLIGIKLKNIISLITGFIICETIIIIGPYEYCDMIYCLINKQNYIESFFWNYPTILMPSNIISGYNWIVIICAILIFSIFAISLYIIIKTKHLRNTKRDMKLKTTLFAITALIALFWTICSLSITGLVFSNKNYITDKAYNEFYEIEREFIKNIDSFMTLDENRIDNELNKLIEKTNIPPQYEEGIHNTINWSNGFITISEEFDEYEAEALKQYGITMYCVLGNPFSFTSQEKLIYTSENGDSTNLNTVPLPAEMHFTYSQNNCSINFNYNYDDYFQKGINYSYNFDSRKFELQYNLNLSFEKETTLSKKQSRLLETVLKDNFYSYNDEVFSSSATEFGKKGKYFWYETYGVYKNDINENLYKIDMSFTAYDIQITSGVPDYILFNDDEPVLGATFFVKFSEDNAELIDWYYPESDEYKSTSKLISLVEETFNKKSIINLKESDPARQNNNDLVHLKNKIREDYYNKYAH